MKIAHLLLVRNAELSSARCNCVLHIRAKVLTSDVAVNAKDSILFDLVSVEDCEHFARRRSLLVGAWPMLNCSTETALAGRCNGTLDM